MAEHVNINGGLFEAGVERVDGGDRGVITAMDLPVGQVPVMGGEFPVIVGGRSGVGRLRGISWLADMRRETTIDFELEAG